MFTFSVGWSVAPFHKPHRGAFVRVSWPHRGSFATILKPKPERPEKRPGERDGRPWI